MPNSIKYLPYQSYVVFEKNSGDFDKVLTELAFDIAKPIDENGQKYLAIPDELQCQMSRADNGLEQYVVCRGNTVVLTININRNGLGPHSAKYFRDEIEFKQITSIQFVGGQHASDVSITADTTQALDETLESNRNDLTHLKEFHSLETLTAKQFKLLLQPGVDQQMYRAGDYKQIVAQLVKDPSFKNHKNVCFIGREPDDITLDTHCIVTFDPSNPERSIALYPFTVVITRTNQRIYQCSLNGTSYHCNNSTELLAHLQPDMTFTPIYKQNAEEKETKKAAPTAVRQAKYRRRGATRNGVVVFTIEPQPNAIVSPETDAEKRKKERPQKTATTPIVRKPAETKNTTTLPVPPSLLYQKASVQKQREYLTQLLIIREKPASFYPFEVKNDEDDSRFQTEFRKLCAQEILLDMLIAQYDVGNYLDKQQLMTEGDFYQSAFHSMHSKASELKKLIQTNQENPKWQISVAEYEDIFIELENRDEQYSEAPDAGDAKRPTPKATRYRSLSTLEFNALLNEKTAELTALIGMAETRSKADENLAASLRQLDEEYKSARDEKEEKNWQGVEAKNPFKGLTQQEVQAKLLSTLITPLHYGLSEETNVPVERIEYVKLMKNYGKQISDANVTSFLTQISETIQKAKQALQEQFKQVHRPVVLSRNEVDALPPAASTAHKTQAPKPAEVKTTLKAADNLPASLEMPENTRFIRETIDNSNKKNIFNFIAPLMVFQKNVVSLQWNPLLAFQYTPPSLTEPVRRKYRRRGEESSNKPNDQYLKEAAVILKLMEKDESFAAITDDQARKLLKRSYVMRRVLFAKYRSNPLDGKKLSDINQFYASDPDGGRRPLYQEPTIDEDVSINNLANEPCFVLYKDAAEIKFDNIPSRNVFALARSKDHPNALVCSYHKPIGDLTDQEFTSIQCVLNLTEEDIKLFPFHELYETQPFANSLQSAKVPQLNFIALPGSETPKLARLAKDIMKICHGTLVEAPKPAVPETKVKEKDPTPSADEKSNPAALMQFLTSSQMVPRFQRHDHLRNVGKTMGIANLTQPGQLLKLMQTHQDAFAADPAITMSPQQDPLLLLDRMLKLFQFQYHLFSNAGPIPSDIESIAEDFHPLVKPLAKRWLMKIVTDFYSHRNNARSTIAGRLDSILQSTNVVDALHKGYPGIDDWYKKIATENEGFEKDYLLKLAEETEEEADAFASLYLEIPKKEFLPLLRHHFPGSLFNIRGAGKIYPAYVIVEENNVKKLIPFSSEDFSMVKMLDSLGWALVFTQGFRCAVLMVRQPYGWVRAAKCRLTIEEQQALAKDGRLDLPANIIPKKGKIESKGEGEKKASTDPLVLAAISQAANNEIANPQISKIPQGALIVKYSYQGPKPGTTETLFNDAAGTFLDPSGFSEAHVCNYTNKTTKTMGGMSVTHSGDRRMKNAPAGSMHHFMCITPPEKGKESVHLALTTSAYQTHYTTHHSENYCEYYMLVGLSEKEKETVKNWTENATPDNIDRLKQFFKDKGVKPFHSVSPSAYLKEVGPGENAKEIGVYSHFIASVYYDPELQACFFIGWDSPLNLPLEANHERTKEFNDGYSHPVNARIKTKQSQERFVLCADEKKTQAREARLAVLADPYKDKPYKKWMPLLVELISALKTIKTVIPAAMQALDAQLRKEAELRDAKEDSEEVKAIAVEKSRDDFVKSDMKLVVPPKFLHAASNALVIHQERSKVPGNFPDDKTLGRPFDHIAFQQKYCTEEIARLTARIAEIYQALKDFRYEQEKSAATLSNLPHFGVFSESVTDLKNGFEMLVAQINTASNDVQSILKNVLPLANDYYQASKAELIPLFLDALDWLIKAKNISDRCKGKSKYNAQFVFSDEYRKLQEEYKLCEENHKNSLKLFCYHPFFSQTDLTTLGEIPSLRELIGENGFYLAYTNAVGQELSKALMQPGGKPGLPDPQLVRLYQFYNAMLQGYMKLRDFSPDFPKWQKKWAKACSKASRQPVENFLAKVTEVLPTFDPRKKAASKPPQAPLLSEPKRTHRGDAKAVVSDATVSLVERKSVAVTTKSVTQMLTAASATLVAPSGHAGEPASTPEASLKKMSAGSSVTASTPSNVSPSLQAVSEEEKILRLVQLCHRLIACLADEKIFPPKPARALITPIHQGARKKTIKLLTDELHKFKQEQINAKTFEATIIGSLLLFRGKLKPGNQGFLENFDRIIGMDPSQKSHTQETVILKFIQDELARNKISPLEFKQ